MKRYLILLGLWFLTWGLVIYAAKHFLPVGSPQREVPVARQPVVPLDPEKLEIAKQFTVLISNEGFTGGYRGTGILIDSTHVLTCAHMVHEGEMWIYTYPVSRVRMGTPIYGDRRHDLAILELSEPVLLDHYAVFNTTPIVGQPIVLIGNILGGMKWFVSDGVISEKLEFYLLTDALSRGGNSGGPWLDMNGQVVAITDWGLEKKEVPIGVSGGVSAKQIEAFLKSWKSPTLFDIIIGSLVWR